MDRIVRRVTILRVGHLLWTFMLALYLALSQAPNAQARFISPDDWNPTQAGVGTNRYAYGQNDPINNADANGHVIESLWDAGNAAWGWASFHQNWSKGNYISAGFDFVGAAIDSAATAVPLAPGGATTVVQGTRKVGGAVIDYAKSLRSQGYHIVPKELADHPAIKAAGFDVEGYANKVMLPSQADTHKTRTVHRAGRGRITEKVSAPN